MPFIILLSIFLFSEVSFAFDSQNISQKNSAHKNSDLLNVECPLIEDRSSLKVAWFINEPYQYSMRSNVNNPIGIDIDLLKLYTERLDLKLIFKDVPWSEQLSMLQNGTLDMLTGITYSPERAKYLHFSKAYRFEEDCLFTLHDSKKLTFKNISEFLGEIKIKNFKLGVIDGFVYADAEINRFISDPINKNFIIHFSSIGRGLEELTKGLIDGLIDDRITAVSKIIKLGLQKEINEIDLGIKAPVHIAFSKKTVSEDRVLLLNKIITELENSKAYKETIKNYIYPVMLLRIMNTSWFNILSIIGVIAFAISGSVLAYRDNTTLFGTLIYALLPAVGGGMVRDIIINTERVGVLSTPYYISYVVITVLLYFTIVKFLTYYYDKSNDRSYLENIYKNIVLIFDALGQAVFTITGISVVVINGIGPIELWGPFFAFLTTNGGGIIRDCLSKNPNNITNSNDLNGEITILWGFLFSAFLGFNNIEIRPEALHYAVVITICGVFFTRIFSYYAKVPNIKFNS